MEIQDPNQFKEAVMGLVQPFVGKAMSPNNFRKFQMTMQKLVDLPELQKYITNFLLKGSGMGVTEDVMDAIAGMLNEERVPLSVNQYKLISLVGEYGYRATLLSC